MQNDPLWMTLCSVSAWDEFIVAKALHACERFNCWGIPNTEESIPLPLEPALLHMVPCYERWPLPEMLTNSCTVLFNITQHCVKSYPRTIHALSHIRYRELHTYICKCTLSNYLTTIRIPFGICLNVYTAGHKYWLWWTGMWSQVMCASRDGIILRTGALRRGRQLVVRNCWLSIYCQLRLRFYLCPGARRFIFVLNT